jgi:hypothetical protein
MRRPLRTLTVNGKRFLELSAADRWLLVQAACILATVKLALRCLPLRVTRRALAYLGRKPASTPPEVQERAIRAVSTASGLVPGGGNCFARALTLQTLLARRGVATEVHIGFARAQGGAVEGHAWLTHEGHVIMGNLDDLERFESAPVRAAKVGR